MTTDIHVKFEKLPGDLDYKYFVHDRATGTYLKHDYWVSDIEDATPYKTQYAAERAMNNWRMSLQPAPVPAPLVDENQTDMFAKG